MTGGCHEERSKYILQAALNGFDRLPRPNTESPNPEADAKGVYSCSACHLQFPLLIELRAHYRANHYRGDGERRFECSLCHYEFKQKIHLQRHMEKKHFMPQMRPAPKSRSPLPTSQRQILEDAACRMAAAAATSGNTSSQRSAGELVPYNQRATPGPGNTNDMAAPLDYRTLHSTMLESLQKAIEARTVHANITELNNMLTVAAAVRAAGANQDRDEDDK